MTSARTFIITRSILAGLLFTAAVVCWAEATLSNRVAEAHRRMATLQSTSSEEITGTLTTVGWLAGVPGSLDADVRKHRENSQYWLARYEDLLRAPATAGDDQDPETLLMAANAAFRVAQRDPGRETAVQRLDTVLQAYATTLKNGGFSAEAAYNYEYVARLRDSVSRTKPAAPRSRTPRAAGEPRTTGDLPAGPTIHGRPGLGPPPGTRGNEFEIITPMDFGDREAQPEATPGRKLPRKG